VTHWRQKDSITLHLVNLTNPMMMKGPVRELIPVGKQKIRVALPGNAKPRKVHLLAGGKTVPYKISGNALELIVPEILDHEVVAIDLVKS